MWRRSEIGYLQDDRSIGKHIIMEAKFLTLGEDS
jgi:hypothetical protein